MTSGTRLVWKKEFAHSQSSAEVGRRRLAFVTGAQRLRAVTECRVVAAADAVTTECCSIPAKFESMEGGGERIFIGGRVRIVTADSEQGRTSRQVALSRWCVSRRLKHRAHFEHLARVVGITGDDGSRLVDRLRAKQWAFD